MRIILYRYHNNVDYCIDRLKMIKKYNPDILIYGLYGGEEKHYADFEKDLECFLDGNYCIKNKSQFWKWKNSDLAYRLWYKDYGYKLSFDSLIVLEWDLIMFDSLDNIYKNIKEEQVGLTGLVPLRSIEKEWFWTRDPEQRSYWLELLTLVKNQFGFEGEPYGALCPGVSLPRKFLEAYTVIDPSELCHDELRLPLYAQALGFELVDTGFYKKWFSRKEWKYFNCNNKSITLKIIKRELKKDNGRRTFHPFRVLLSEAGFL